MNCLAIIPWLLEILAIIFGGVGSAWCQMVTIPLNPNFRLANGTRPEFLNTLPEQQYGLWMKREIAIEGLWADPSGWYAAYSNVCTHFLVAITNLDVRYWSAMILQGICWAVALFQIVIMLCAICGKPGKLICHGIVLLCICTPCQGLVFLVLTSNFCKNNPDLAKRQEELLPGLETAGISLFEDRCTLGPGGIMVIVSTCLYFMAGCLCCCCGGSKNESATTEEAPPPTASGQAQEGGGREEDANTMGDKDFFDAPTVNTTSSPEKTYVAQTGVE